MFDIVVEHILQCVCVCCVVCVCVCVVLCVCVCVWCVCVLLCLTIIARIYPEHGSVYQLSPAYFELLQYKLEPVHIMF